MCVLVTCKVTGPVHWPSLFPESMPGSTSLISSHDFRNFYPVFLTGVLLIVVLFFDLQKFLLILVSWRRCLIPKPWEK